MAVQLRLSQLIRWDETASRRRSGDQNASATNVHQNVQQVQLSRSRDEGNRGEGEAGD